MTTMTTIRSRAFAAFWWLLHLTAAAVAIGGVSSSAPGHLAGDIPGIAVATFAPLVILLVARWIVTGRWRLGPRL
jgi:hypothetical protein